MSRSTQSLINLVLCALVLAGLFMLLRRGIPEMAAEQLTVRTGISATAPQPDWSELDAFQKTITRSDFVAQLEGVYSEGEAWRSAVDLHEDHALILGAGNNDQLRLDFAAAEVEQEADPSGDEHVDSKVTPEASAPPRYWRSAAQMPPLQNPEESPLSGIRIAIDPGHIGGEWAKMEERWYQINNQGTEVQEGDLTLATAKVLKPMLEKLGAEVFLVRNDTQPVTRKRPEDFIDLATAEMKRKGGDPSDETALRRESEKLFYRAWEIRRRAQVINQQIKPDLVLCLHYNAESWGNPNNPQLVNRNHFHLLINGTYSPYEFRLEDNRFHLFKRLLARTHDEELPLNESVAEAMAEATGLPRYIYTTKNAKLIGQSGFTYARNLLANRIYHCPIVFLEPYVMNSEEVYQRVGAGDYEGLKTIAGKERLSIMREYATGVTEGLKRYYRAAREIKRGART